MKGDNRVREGRTGEGEGEGDKQVRESYFGGKDGGGGVRTKRGRS